MEAHRGQHRRTIGRVGAALAVGAGGLLLSAAPAQAVPVEIAGCLVDGAPAMITMESETVARYEGAYLPLHYFDGYPVDPDLELHEDHDAPPLCVVPVVDGVARSEEATWAWCQQLEVDSCSEEPLHTMGLEERISDEVAALVLWRLELFAVSGSSAPDDIWGTQQDIWCVTDPNAYYDPPYVGAPEETDSCEQYRAWLFEHILPTLALPGDQVEVTAPTSPVPTGSTQTFTVTSTVSPLTIRTVGADSVSVCEGETGGTLTETDPPTLTIASPSNPVDLCVTRAASGPVSLTAESVLITRDSLLTIGNGAEDCQVFLTESTQGVALAATAELAFAAQATTTTAGTVTTTTDEVTTTPTDRTGVTRRELARTGSGLAQQAAIGAVLLGAGTVLVRHSRRRRLV